LANQFDLDIEAGISCPFKKIVARVFQSLVAGFSRSSHLKSVAFLGSPRSIFGEFPAESASSQRDFESLLHLRPQSHSGSRYLPRLVKVPDCSGHSMLPNMQGRADLIARPALQVEFNRFGHSWPRLQKVNDTKVVVPDFRTEFRFKKTGLSFHPQKSFNSPLFKCDFQRTEPPK
jgi:hypothetical protein